MRRMKPGMSRLSVRVMVATVTISFLASALVTATELYIQYHREWQEAVQRIDAIGCSVSPSLSSSLWMEDNARVDLLLDGLIRLRDVKSVRVDSEGKTFSRGTASVDASSLRSFKLRYDDHGHFDLGTLIIVYDNRQIVGQIRQSAITSMLTAIAALLSTSILSLLLLRSMVTRHLHTIARHARQISIGKCAPDLSLDRAPRHHADELDMVVRAFNTMRTRITDELQVRIRHEEELLLHREKLESIVQYRTIALKKQAELLEKQSSEMKHLVETDVLTNASSRRFILERLSDEIDHCWKEGLPLSALMLDIDEFKRINDNFGHAVGDQTLVSLIDTCRLQLRNIDLIGRMGGEEFVIVLPMLDLRQAHQVAERLRIAVSEIALPLPRGGQFSITVSIGMACLSPIADSADALLAKADHELYRAKQSGRNRVCGADELSSRQLSSLV